MKSSVAVSFIVISFLISPPAQAVVRYTIVRYSITDLGTLGGSSSWARA